MSQIMFVRCGNLVGADDGELVGCHLSVVRVNLYAVIASYLRHARITANTRILLSVNRSRRCRLGLCLVLPSRSISGEKRFT